MWLRKTWIEDLAVQKAMDILHDEVLIDYLVDRIFDLQGEQNQRHKRRRQNPRSHPHPLYRFWWSRRRRDWYVRHKT